MTAGSSSSCAPRTRGVPPTRSSTDRSRPTTRWACITPGAGPTRTSTSGSTRCWARTSAGRTASTARACGWRSTSSASSGFTSKRDIETYGIAEFVSLCKQRVLTYAAVQTEQSIRLGMWMDWNDPDELRRLRDLLKEDPAAGHHRRGPAWPRDGHRGDGRRSPGHARDGRLLLHVQQREQRPHLGLPGRVPPPRLAVQGLRRDALVRALRHGHEPDGDERGLRGPRGPGAHVPAAAGRSPRRVPAGLDHDALDGDLQRRRGRRAGAGVRAHPAGRRQLLAGQGDAQERAARRVQGRRGATRRGARGLDLSRSVRPPAGRPGRVRGGHGCRRRRGLRPPRRGLERRRRGRGHGHRPHRARLRRGGLQAGQGAGAADRGAARRVRPLPGRRSASWRAWTR